MPRKAKDRVFSSSSTSLPFLLTFTLGVAAGCSSEEPIEEEKEANWAEDIAPILYESCTSCHIGDSVQTMEGIGHFPLLTYNDASTVAIYLQQVALSRRMPPWPGRGTSDCQSPLGLVDDPSLDSDEILKVLEWSEGELLMGDPADAPNMPSATETALDSATQSLFPEVPFEPVAVGDTYRCVLMDPEVERQSWLTGVQVIPDNRSLLGTVTTLLVEPESVATLESLVNEDGDFDCFALPQTDGLRYAAMWSPGASPFEPPTGSGFSAKPGTQILMRTHYHVWTDDLIGADQSGLSLRWTTEDPGRDASLVPLGNYETEPELLRDSNESEALFELRAGQLGYEEMQIGATEEQAGQAIWAIGGWMHWAGTEMEISFIDGEDNEGCLLGLQDWNPEYVRTYRFEGETSDFPTWDSDLDLRLRCNYDNSGHNEALANILEDNGHDSPIDLHLGDGQLDENCMTLIGLVDP